MDISKTIEKLVTYKDDKKDKKELDRKLYK